MREITNDNRYVNKDDDSHRDQAPPISNARKQKNIQERIENS